MKIIVACLLAVAVISGITGLAIRYPLIASRDYEEIVLGYVSKVEKEGFNQKDFEDFAYHRKVMRKNLIINGGLERFCQEISLFALTVSLGIVLLKWPKK